MNICYLSKEYPPKIIGGVGTYTYEIAQALVKLGHKVYLITQATDKEGEFDEEGVCVNRVMPAKLVFLNFLRNKLRMTVERLEYSYAVSCKLRQIVKKYKIDIVESCEARAEGFWYYLFHRKPPLVIKLHTPESIIFRWNGEPYNWDNKIVEKLEEFWIFRADRLVAISKAMLNLISRYYKFKFKGVSVVPNPININLFKPDMNLNANNGNPIILYAGRLEFRKGVHILIRAMPAVLKEIPGARFFFIGSDCGMKGYLSRKISELGCSNNVEFIEQIKREELVDFYQKSTVCIVPSLWENYPYSCLESLACGKPLIISDTGGIPEIIKDKINGILVPPGSVSSLADAIVEILNNKKIQETLRCNARKCAEESYASEKIAHKTLNIYKELIN